MTSELNNTIKDYSKGTTKNHTIELSCFESNSLLFLDQNMSSHEIDLNDVLRNREKGVRTNESKNR